MRAHYFAYGSNLDLARMRARVPSAQVVGTALLRGMRLQLDKRGGDGSGKANLRSDASGHVWGVVYTLARAHWAALDACEPGYTRIRVSVECAGAVLDAETYISALRTPEPFALPWYKRLIIDGARAQGLPEAYVALLEDLPERGDPD
ncbi:MAG: gamma-glutamylcyclotransferase [Myxococcales bacterium]|nr:gamma-glutamylcyclotransferase [Myxococcales bacterium]MDH5307225.1 gamma-glutamylcyclotransferase [Myxococcales bacterium]MDH5565058.1 gamma-glutamylcyclotransferase [Myxococcales bacterium]